MNLNFDSNRIFRITRLSISLLWRDYQREDPHGTNPTLVQNLNSGINNILESFLKPENGIIDGSALKDLIFPTGANQDFPDFDVFISHSHNDSQEAEQLAYVLRNMYGKTPFLDKYIWSSADDLLRKIDEAYCRYENNRSFNYTKRNFSTSHVHTMLSMAILEMIAKCKSFIFIESSESLDYNLFKENGEKTLSPWIYQELQYARMLSTAMSHTLNEQREFSEGGQLLISYGADLQDFKLLTSRNIERYFRD